MRLLFVITAIFAFGELSLAQDMDFYIKKNNDRFKYEKIDPKMSFNEYSLLTRDLRLKEMAYATMVPGYVHFWEKDNRTGYVLVGIRAFAYGELAYFLYDLNKNSQNQTWRDVIKKEGLIGSVSYDKDKRTQNSVLVYSALALIVGEYLFDWIHGQYRLQKKQEMIRYKYNLKMNLTSMPGLGKQSYNPGFGLKMQITF